MSNRLVSSSLFDSVPGAIPRPAPAGLICDEDVIAGEGMRRVCAPGRACPREPMNALSNVQHFSGSRGHGTRLGRSLALPIGNRQSAIGNRRGFTLLELIIVVSMTGMLLLSLFMSMSIGMRTRQSVRGAVDPTRSITVAADLIRQDFDCVLNPNGILAGYFIGAHDNGAHGTMSMLEFHCMGSDGYWDDTPGSDGMRRVLLKVDQQVTPPTLVRYVTQNLLATNQQEDQEVLCRGVKGFYLRYFDGVDWQEEWDSTTLGDILPAAVEINIELETPPQRLQEEPGACHTRRIVMLPCCKSSELPGLGGIGGMQ